MLSPNKYTNDYSIIVGLSKAFEDEQSLDHSWVGSPFEWLMRVPSATKGALGKRLVESWAEQRGLEVESGRGTDADRIINGYKVQIRMSTPWEHGPYKFQQIKELDFDFLFCFGVSPNNIHAWLFPVALLKKHVYGRMGQHTGSGSKETSWIQISPTDQPEWSKEYGPTLNIAYEILSGQKRLP